MSSDSQLSLKTFSVNTEQLSALLLWSLMALFHDNHSFISMTTFAQWCCFHSVPGYVCAWFMEVWLGVIPLPGEPANTSTSSSPKLWIITLSICQHQHLSAPQEEPVTHSSFIPVALSRLAYTSGGPRYPLGHCYIYYSVNVLVQEKTWIGKRLSRLHYNTGKDRN